MCPAGTNIHSGLLQFWEALLFSFSCGFDQTEVTKACTFLTMHVCLASLHTLEKRTAKKGKIEVQDEPWQNKNIKALFTGSK
jgi:hypothetical protein